MKRALTSRDWFGKASAGLILGFLLALGSGGLFRVLLGVKDSFFSTRGQLSMWMISPIWALILSFCFMFRSGARAWGWLAAANLALWGLVWLLGRVM